jgi:ABC-type Fe3+ transport system substrate-binding protein
MMGIPKLLGSSLALGIALAFAGTTALTSAGLAATNQEIAQIKGPDRTKILLEGAKKEGKAVLYTPINVNETLIPLGDAFSKKYPGVKLEYWRGGTVEQMAKITAEINSKNQFADLTEGGSGAVQAIKGNMVDPFYSPSLEVYDKAYLDPRSLWAPSRVAYMGNAFNTRQINADQVPKNFEQLLDPKLKGKMVWVPGTDTGAPLFIDNVLKVMGREKGEEYLKKLATQDITPFPSDLNNMTNRLAQGEYTMSIHSTAHDVKRLAKSNAPVEVQMLEPIPGIVNAIQLIKGAPHPHAAMLFLDYFLSEEGQDVLSNHGYMAVHPKVQPSPHLTSIVPRLVGMKEYVVTPESLFEGREVPRELFKKYFDK